jgi:hypothetical protein
MFMSITSSTGKIFLYICVLVQVLNCIVPKKFPLLINKITNTTNHGVDCKDGQIVNSEKGVGNREIALALKVSKRRVK